MFANKKMKAVIALVSVVVLLVSSNVCVLAAPFEYSSIDDVRAKALRDFLSPGPIVAFDAEKYVSNSDITIGARSGEEIVTTTETVEFNIIKRLNPALAAGTVRTVQEGVYGEKTVTYKVGYESGKEISRIILSETATKAPVDKIVEYGNKEEISSETAVDTAKLDYKYVLTCTATAYDMSAEENGGYAGQTATGVPLEKGVIAVDPKVIPLGSRVYIEAVDGSWSYGYAVAADTGGAIKGKKVDLCYRTRYECIQFGRRQCRVYVLN